MYGIVLQHLNAKFASVIGKRLTEIIDEIVLRMIQMLKCRLILTVNKTDSNRPKIKSYTVEPARKELQGAVGSCSL